MTTGDAPPFEAPARKVVHRPVPVVALTLFIALQMLLRVPQPNPGLRLFTLAIFLALVASAIPLLFRRNRGGVVRVDDAWISVDGRPILRRDQITGAARRTSAAGESVVLTRPFGRGTSVNVIFSDRRDADDLVAALGRGVHQSVATFQVRAVHRKRELLAMSVGLCIIFWFGVAAPYRALVGPFCVAVLMPLLLLGDQRRLTVGTDGLLVEPRILGAAPRRFVSFAELEKVERVAGKITVHLSSGQARSFSVDEKMKTRMKDERFAPADALVARIEEARRRFEDASGVVSLGPLLSRGGRGVSAWVAEVQQLRSSIAPLRGLGVPPEELLRVLDDPRSSPDARAGAAVALRSAVGRRDDVRQRLQNAARSCAEPSLRRLLDVASRTEEPAPGELEAALAAVEPGPGSRRGIA